MASEQTVVEPFLFTGKDVGVLLIHGFTGSTTELRPLGKRLHEAGYTVKAPILAGHGTCVQDMEQTGWRDWVSSAKEAYDELRTLCRSVAIVGHSMGGTIALHLASKYPCSAVVTICAPVFLKDRLAFLARPYSYIKRYITKKSTYSDHVRNYLTGYKETPLRCVGDLLKLIRMSRNDLPLIKMPALVMQSCQDLTVRPESAQYIYEHVGSAAKEIKWYENSGHILPVDADSGRVFEDIVSFLGKYIGPLEADESNHTPLLSEEHRPLGMLHHGDASEMIK